MIDKNREITDKYKYHYTYMITNLNNHMRYIGVRSCNCGPTEDTKYGGSCNNLKKSILKEGKEGFKKNILAIGEIRKLACEHEVRLHNYFGVGINPMFYNKVKQTHTGFDFSGINKTKQHKEKISISNSNLVGIHKGKELKRVDINHISSYLDSGGIRGLTEERKEHNRICKIGHINSEETRKKMSIAQKKE